ncbi:MAG: zinc ribbon-containing protein [Methylococcales bacterium]|nr:zinc ribbon-containing protein [Methylococcales bacterium]
MSRNTKLIEAYNTLIEHLYEAMDDTLHSTADALDIAKEKLSGLGGLTQEEITHIADALTRDIDHVAVNVEKKEENLSAWLKFDIDLIENFAFDAFISLADKTRLELEKIGQQANKYHPYHSGDITSPGTLMCEACEKEIAFKSTSEIPACPHCQAKVFVRS